MLLPSYRHKFSGVINIHKNDVHAERDGQSSMLRVTEVKANFVPILAFVDCNSSLDLQVGTKFVVCVCVCGGGGGGGGASEQVIGCNGLSLRRAAWE